MEEQQELQIPQFYQIDFDKVNTLEDFKAIIKGLRIQFTHQAPAWDEIKDYLIPIE
jgi:hypothetical protein